MSDPSGDQQRWTAVDAYVGGLFVAEDAALAAAVRESASAGLPPIQVSAAQGKMLYLLARMAGARNILEIGTLGGYSTICLGRALPEGGRLISLEIDPKHAAVATANLARAGLAAAAQVLTGRAQDTLPDLAKRGRGPFDFIFIDADKQSYPEYFTWALSLSRPGTAIVIDNVVRQGAVLDADSSDPMVRGVRRLNELIAAEPRVSATTIQTVGAKGYDGFTLAVVRAVSAS